jgi:hypothetical protein
MSKSDRLTPVSESAGQRQDRDAESSDASADEASGAKSQRWVRRLGDSIHVHADRVRQRLSPYEHVPIVNILLRTYDTDRQSGGAVLGSALAYRLFLFFVPLLLLFTGIAGLFSGFVDPASVESGIGVSGALPGAVVMGVILAVLQAVSELYLPDRFHRASQLYGAIGTTLVILGWFFVLGRSCVLSIELNAAIHQLYGSISRLIFALPLVRRLPERSPRLRRSDLERESVSGESGAGRPKA